VIEVRGLTKSFGGTVAVDDLSFTVGPGKVTGFLGPNGAGKTTTMRLITGLDHPTRGEATVNGRPFGQLVRPMREMGVLLDARAAHGGRSARANLLCLAQGNGMMNTGGSLPSYWARKTSFGGTCLRANRWN